MKPAPPQHEQSLHALLTLIQLEQRLRWAKADEARFIAVNETTRLFAYRQAVLIEWEHANPLPAQATAASGVSQVSPDSPLVRLLLDLAPQWREKPFTTITEISLPADSAAEVRAQVERDRLYAIPVEGRAAERRGVLVVMRRQPLTSGEAMLAEKLADALAGAIQSDGQRLWQRAFGWLWHKPKRRAILAACVLLLFLPVRASVLAPAEVVGVDPVVIRSSMQGVIALVHVSPNDVVATGDPLISFDEEELRAKVEASGQSMAAASSELRQANVQAVSDAEARANLATARGRLEQQKINLEYARSQLGRSTITAPVPGVVVFDNTYDWIGRSVSIGERIMLLADPARTQVEIRLPVQDNISLPDKARVLFFSAAAPHRPIEAAVSFASYRASMDERNTLSYRLEATWTSPDQDNLPRLGSVGNAKIYGPYRPLIWQVLRKPFAVTRAFIGI